MTARMAAWSSVTGAVNLAVDMMFSAQAWAEETCVSQST